MICQVWEERVVVSVENMFALTVLSPTLASSGDVWAVRAQHREQGLA